MLLPNGSKQDNTEERLGGHWTHTKVWAVWKAAGGNTGTQAHFLNAAPKGKNTINEITSCVTASPLQSYIISNSNDKPFKAVPDQEMNQST